MTHLDIEFLDVALPIKLSGYHVTQSLQHVTQHQTGAPIGYYLANDD